MRLPRPRIDGPAPTIRLRLTVLYGLVFLVTGAILLTSGYALVRHNLYDATVCLRNSGAARVQFAGNLTPQAGVKLPGKDVIRYDWLFGGKPTWWDVAPKIATRFAVVKASFVGSWTFWAVFGVLALVWASAIAVLLRRADQ